VRAPDAARGVLIVLAFASASLLVALQVAAWFSA
jgi:hypothetical protein